jgi:hypothetical protein
MSTIRLLAEARQAMRDYLAKWEEAGFRFTLDWLLRNATAVVKGRALFTALGIQNRVQAAIIAYEAGLDTER